MNPLIDINIILDVLLVRQQWLREAERIWEANRTGIITAAIAAFALPTVFYVIRRQTDLARAHAAVDICLGSFEIVPVHRSTLELARTFPGNDFEDNAHIACAIEGKKDFIITRDPTGFHASPVPVLGITEAAQRLGQRPEKNS
jgi:predicted nucleic acid-binding protein